MAVYASRYASALADIVTANHLDPAAIDAQLGDFAAAWAESAPLREVFTDPSFTPEKKVAILDRLNSKLQMSPTVRNFLAVLSNHNRMEGFHTVMAAYRREMNTRLGIEEVEVTTARPLNDPARQALEARLAELSGTRIRATFREDSTLVGGALVRVGSMVYDGSVRGRLDQLREKLAAS